MTRPIKTLEDAKKANLGANQTAHALSEAGATKSARYSPEQITKRIVTVMGEDAGVEGLDSKPTKAIQARVQKVIAWLIAHGKIVSEFFNDENIELIARGEREDAAHAAQLLDFPPGRELNKELDEFFEEHCG